MASIPPSPVCVLLHEQLTALLSDCETVMNNAAYGQTVNDLDNFLLIARKKFIHEVLQQKLGSLPESMDRKGALRRDFG